jgi:hypothetical protein
MESFNWTKREGDALFRLRDSASTSSTFRFFIADALFHTRDSASTSSTFRFFTADAMFRTRDSASTSSTFRFVRHCSYCTTIKIHSFSINKEVKHS